MNRYYVGIGGENCKRTIFRSANTPELETHGSIYNCVIGPFRTKRGAIFMRDHGANNPHCQTVADAERISKEIADRNDIADQTLFVGSAWWRDNDPFVTLVGNSARAVEKALYRAMRDAAIDAYNSSEPEDKKRVRDYLDEIAWSGVSTFAFADIIPERAIEAYEPAFKDEVTTFTHSCDMDYFDYEALRRGDKTVVVYV